MNAETVCCRLAIERTLSTDFVHLEQKADLSLAAMSDKLDLFRREMLAEIKAAAVGNDFYVVHPHFMDADPPSVERLTLP